MYVCVRICTFCNLSTCSFSLTVSKCVCVCARARTHTSLWDKTYGLGVTLEKIVVHLNLQMKCIRHSWRPLRVHRLNATGCEKGWKWCRYGEQQKVRYSVWHKTLKKRSVQFYIGSRKLELQSNKKWETYIQEPIRLSCLSDKKSLLEKKRNRGSWTWLLNLSKHNLTTPQNYIS